MEMEGIWFCGLCASAVYLYPGQQQPGPLHRVWLPVEHEDALLRETFH